jgi:ATP-dependent RNA circularization protein (DNA/RNA ligase family)
VSVTEKLDGSNVSICKINDEIIPLGRAGYRAISSPFEQHKMFHNWVFKNFERFNSLLKNGERCAGEWLAQAHGTRYELKHEPYVIFDIFRENSRISIDELYNRCGELNLINPRLLHSGSAISIEDILNLTQESGHGAIDPVEGAVWRMERRGVFNFMGKYVRDGKIDGCYLPEITGKDAIWNWRPQ